VDTPEAEKPAADEARGLPVEGMLGGLLLSRIAISEPKQDAARGPSPDVIAEVDELLLDTIFADLSMIWSYAASAIEAARRSDHKDLRLLLRVELRDLFRHAVKTHDLLSTERSAGSGS
jgi:hypothetical protein